MWKAYFSINSEDSERVVDFPIFLSHMKEVCEPIVFRLNLEISQS